MSRTTTTHIIKVQGSGTQIEAVGTSTLLPGHLLEFDANGYVQRHSEAGAPAFMFADITKTPDTYEYPSTAKIDIPYKDGETVYAFQPNPGDIVYAKIASGQNVTKGRDMVTANLHPPVLAMSHVAQPTQLLPRGKMRTRAAALPFAV